MIFDTDEMESDTVGFEDLTELEEGDSAEMDSSLVISICPICEKPGAYTQLEDEYGELTHWGWAHSIFGVWCPNCRGWHYSVEDECRLAKGGDA